uniref:NB-ARC domain-containing protein n=1 Tax=Physcomitrium patens TaxID=3218 RepID=A0A2K1J032_PHYPA|nr:hypothetical protein PHYPA_022790 [Physcomitrium patens]
MLAKYFLSLKFFLLDISWEYKLKEELIDKALQMLHDKDVWTKFKSLNVFQLRNYSFLENFLNLFFRIPTLLKLDLERCSNLIMLPNELEYIFFLKILNLKDCNRLRLFPTSIKSLLALKNLNIRRYSNLTLFPNELGNLTSMTTFDIS